MVRFNMLLLAVAFLCASGVALAGLLLVSGYNRRLKERLQKLPPQSGPVPRKRLLAALTRSALPRIANPLVPDDEKERSRLKTQLIQAGLYSRQAMIIYLSVKMFLIILPAVAGLSTGLLGFLPLRNGLAYGLVASVLGIIGPSFWLESKKKKQQSNLRRALPDALDIIVICLEGGLSLPGAFRRVTSELATAHPKLGAELRMLQRDIQLGLSAGEALRKFAQRCDLEEIRSLASVVLQAEKFGASMARVLRLHADVLRLRRLQRAEEMAQKAAVKILFPTILCIFPAIFLVFLGPAAIQIQDMFAKMK